MKGKPIEPGCLALIVRARTTPENVGKVVRVVRPAEPGYCAPFGPRAPRTPQQLHRTEFAWVVQTLDGATDLVVEIQYFRKTPDGGVGDYSRSKKYLTAERAFKPYCLMRIDDGEDYSHETTNEVKECTT